MQTAIQNLTQTDAPLVTTPGIHPRRRWLMRAGALGLVVLLVGLAGNSAGWWGGAWLNVASGAAGEIYTVQPLDLNIVLTEDGELKPQKSIQLKCEVEGQSTITFIVEESTRVKKGDLLAELASEQLKERLESEEIELQKLKTSLEAARQDLFIQQNQNASDIKKSRIDLEVADLDLRQYLEGDFQKSLKSADIEIQQTEMDIARKTDELQKNEKLAEKGFVTPSKLEQLRFELEKAQMTLEKNNLTKRILLEYDRPKAEKQRTSTADRAREELERTQQRAESREKQAAARVQENEALVQMREGRVSRLRLQLEKCRIFAPVDGIVQYNSEDWGWREEHLALGTKVSEGQTLIILPDTSQMLVSTRIHEADRHKIREGLECVVRVPAVPGQSFRGTLAKIAKFADSANRWLNPELKEHTAEILLDHTEAPLSPGDSAEVKILVESIPQTLAVPVQSVFTRGRRSFVFVQSLGRTLPVEVTTGRANVNLVQISAGVQEGDRVLLHAGEDLLALLPAPGASEPAAMPAPAPKPAEAAAVKAEDPPASPKTETAETKVTTADGDSAGSAAPTAAAAKPAAAAETATTQ